METEIPRRVFLFYGKSMTSPIYPNDVWDSDSFALEKLPGSVGWYPQSSGESSLLTSIDFPDVDTGWAVSTSYEILHSTNGGDTWFQQDDDQPYPLTYNDVCFVDTQTGWIVGNGGSLGGIILHTTDAGDNWIAQESYSGYDLRSVFFLDANTDWAVGG
jgi:photosystem II stability/assembly factor-like uncharacterized protein